ncbi:MAG: hypothetical protein JW827_06890, partial [Spirochaetes bacterium]|nr:hypothetical protein [Spirochaetota bacterium]
MKKITIILLISGLFIHTAMAIPAMINYRGKLFQSGMPVTGSRNIDFRIFNVSTGGIALWSSGYQSVEVNNGYYHYTLGKNVVIDPIIFTNAALYLEVEIQGAGGALDPRERIVSVGYALNAHMVNGQHSTNLNYWSKNTNNVYRLTGNFGLGALPGSHRLTVGGASSFWDDLYLNQNDLYDAYSFSISPDDDAQTGIKFENALSAIKGSLEYTFNDPPGNTFLFRNCGKLGISISSNGYVGIGSSTPIEQLEITENFRMPLTTTASGIIYAGANRFIHNYGIGNTFLGLNSGVLSGTGANYNIGIGENTLDNLSTGDYNIGIGVNALSSINTGLRNIGIGYYALFNNTAGQYNTCIGHNAGYQA